MAKANYTRNIFHKTLLSSTAISKARNLSRLISLRQLSACFICSWLFSALLSGCETPAHQLTLKSTEFVKEGTSRDEVVKTFGSPKEILKANKRTLLRYEQDYRGRRDITGSGPQILPRIVSFSVLLDGNDRVMRTQYSSHEVYVHFNIDGTTSAPQLLSKLNLARIHPGTTTRKEALSILGEPALDSLTPDGKLIVIWKDWRSGLEAGLNRPQAEIIFDKSDTAAAIKVTNQF